MPTTVRPKKPKPEKPQRPPKPPANPPPVLPSRPAPIAAKLGSYGNASIDQWDSAFIAASLAVFRKKGVTVNPLVMKAIMDVETGGNGNYPASRCRAKDSYDDVPACGPMQIKYAYHKLRCPECDFTTVPGQIELATHIIGDTMKARGGDEYDALTATYFPADDPGHSTQNQYVARVKDLVAQMGGTTPAPKPEPEPQADVLDLLFGGNPYEVSAGYGQLVTWSCPGCYDYFTAYGLDSAHHWAYDAAANAGDGAPLYAPFDGKVVCAGTGNGQGAWGTGCAAFQRVNNYGGKSTGPGAGRLELLHADGGRSLILGHALSSRVTAGTLVKAGDLIGQQGGMNGSHVHVEGRYANGTRIGDPRQLFGGDGVMYADRIPIPQPDQFETFWQVRATRDGVPVLQRADLNASPVRKPLAKGEDFEAVYVVIANDGSAWWVSSLGSRIPVDGTEAIGGPVIRVV